jgi:hypothetical protein
MTTTLEGSTPTTPAVAPGSYSPVTVDMADTVGATFLGIIALVLLVAFVRSEARCRALTARLAALVKD